MKHMMILILIILCCIACEKELSQIELDKDVITVRKIGHEIMRYTGDSTTSLNPVVELGERSYLLEFESKFAFTSDSIIEIIDRSIVKDGTNDYLVKVHSCSNEELIFSYFTSPSDEETLQSCMGRNQSKDCYKVEIQFLTAQWANNDESIWFLLALPFLGFFIFWQLKRSKNEESSSTYPPHGIAVGRFTFDYDSQVLIDGDQKQTLTYKESKIMKVLTRKLNEVVEREELQQQVWEDDGIVVGRSLDMFISKLRKKLNADKSVEIKNIHGIGYKLMVS